MQETMSTQMRTGYKSHKTISSETKQINTMQTMAKNSLIKIRGSRHALTSINRIETRTEKVDPTAALQTGVTGTKMAFISSR